MKNISLYINESIKPVLKGCLTNVLPVIEFMTGENDDIEEVADLSDDNYYDLLRTTISNIKNASSKIGRVDLRIWNPDYDDDPDEEWDYFYDESGLKRGTPVVVLHTDGDDETFSYVAFKNKNLKKDIKDFIDLFNENWVDINTYGF